VNDDDRFLAMRELRAATQALQVGRWADARMAVELVRGMLEVAARDERRSTLPPPSEGAAV